MNETTLTPKFRNFLISDEGTMTVVFQPAYKWQPQPDITAYELALCLPALLANNGWAVGDLPAEVKRHFVERTG